MCCGFARLVKSPTERTPSMSTATRHKLEMLRTLPSDAARQIQWGFADRYDLQMLVQSVRAVARGTVARLVAQGGRNTHEWTPAKAEMLEAFDQSGITAVFMDPEQGGFIAGPRNLALALVAFELAWVDGGAATASLAGCLALAPIHERGTPEQQDRYMRLAAPPQPGEDRKPWRGAFCLTEPIPYVGVDTGMLDGKVRIVEWKPGQEPILQVEKRGRFTTNIGFANFVTAAVDSGDERIKGSCMVILEEGDPGVFDRGTATRKMVHQLSSTGDPIFNLRAPASRIVGGYDIKDGVLVPRYSQRGHRSGVPAHSRDRGCDDRGQVAVRCGTGDPLSTWQIPRCRHGHSWLGTPRDGLAVARRCPPPAGGCMGYGGGKRFAGVRSRAGI